MDLRASGSIQLLQAQRSIAQSNTSMIGSITDTKFAGKRSAGNPHAPFDAAGTGNELRYG